MNRFLPFLADVVRRFKDGLASSTHGPYPPRRRLLLGSAMLAAAIALPHPAGAQDWIGDRWATTWGTAPAGPPPEASLQTFTDQTVRLVVHTSIGGNRVRIRVSNEMGSVPLTVGAARIGLRAGGSDVAAGTDRALTFGGRSAVTIPPGAPVLSDPVELNVPPLSDLAISLYLPGTVQATTLHALALQTGYVSLPGNFTAAATLPVQRTITIWPFLTAVEVDAAGLAIVALGDSITDGTRSTPDTNNRWPDWLARRLQTERDSILGISVRLGVVNRGISGNRLLGNSPNALAGRSALERFDRDVLSTAGVRLLVVLVGINDIGNSSATNPVTAEDLIAGYRQLIARAHAKGIGIVGATLTPFEGAGYYSPEKEVVRQAVNSWIRNHDEFDAVLDFDRATRDPSHPSRLLPAYDSGDHLHPNDLGYQAMGNAVPLTLLRRVNKAAPVATP
ncbi:SGNH/GDSL hydrolase family protein [Telluria aromaticivorans]|uniref:SGNH/GDSL hydrolase family protein n=1 Tax=Telluria aromaticivorans TaxID=2725995 RepID=A0A7Y2NYN7_9BURK|nr:SGNH/GDSL hydrolase family protein [Telluria aromaticivorans]NNG22194.1 SGNH/GDSL hydrolase family protein [Telluria aromaticivorans]